MYKTDSVIRTILDERYSKWGCPQWCIERTAQLQPVELSLCKELLLVSRIDIVVCDDSAKGLDRIKFLVNDMRHISQERCAFLLESSS